MDCPTCNGTTTKVIETHCCTNGTRRRRYRCFDCEHRWTVWDGERPLQGGAPGTRRLTGNRKTRLRVADIRLVLTRLDLNNKQAAELIGCSAENVRQIRNGQTCASILPELIRPKAIRQKPSGNGPNCLNCKEWINGRCSFDFPDPLLEGLTFAADCGLYQPVSQSISRD